MTQFTKFYYEQTKTYAYANENVFVWLFVFVWSWRQWLSVIYMFTYSFQHMFIADGTILIEFIDHIYDDIGIWCSSYWTIISIGFPIDVVVHHHHHRHHCWWQWKNYFEHKNCWLTDLNTWFSRMRRIFFSFVFKINKLSWKPEKIETMNIINDHACAIMLIIHEWIPAQKDTIKCIHFFTGINAIAQIIYFFHIHQ